MIAIAPTDLNWFNLLREDSSQLVINFWTPTPWNIKKLKKGDKFYFLLKAPIRKIGGYGYFKGYQNLSVNNAWIQFGKGNGVKSASELLNRCSDYIKKNSNDKNIQENYKIGCIILDHPVFFDEADFFRPEDYKFEFSKNIVKHKYFEKDFPLYSKTVINNITKNFSLIKDDGKKYTPQNRLKREGQTQFRKNVLEEYGNKCAVTNESCLDVLQAAHIQSYINEGSNHIQNGICLRMDIHKLFDNGLISIDEDYKILVSHLLKSSGLSTLFQTTFLRAC